MRTKSEVKDYVDTMGHAGVTIYFEDHDTVILQDGGKLVHYEFDVHGLITHQHLLKDDKHIEEAMEL